MLSQKLQPGAALLIVDVQNDFCPEGALAVPDGQGVVPEFNAWIEAAVENGCPVYATRDWHPPGHSSFQQEGGPWPEHCVQGSRGAAFHPDLALPARAEIVNKAVDADREAYSGFDGTGLAARLRASNVRELWVGGLALEYCVRATILDALRFGFRVHLILSATRALDLQPGGGRRTIEELEQAGAMIEESESR